MDGVTIIFENTYHNISFIVFILIVFVTLSLIALSIIYLRKLYKIDSKLASKILPLICTGLIMSVSVAGFVIIVNMHNTTTHEYVVSVDDTVSFNEFCEHYEIVHKNDDNTYIVKEIK